MLTPLIADSPAIVDRQALVLTPEGALGTSFRSVRLIEAAHRRVLIDAGDVTRLLRRQAEALGATPVSTAGEATVRFERGQVVGIAAVEQGVRARCTVFSGGPRSIPAMSAGLLPALSSDDADLVTEWRLRVDGGTVAERLGLDDGEASEWWLYGDPLRESQGRARFLASRGTAALQLIVPLHEVRRGWLVVTSVMRRLLEHPILTRFLGDTEVSEVTGFLRPRREVAGVRVGDGYVHLSNGASSLMDPIGWEIDTGLAAAAAIDQALDGEAVNAARLLSLRSAIRAIDAGYGEMSAGPLDAWGDELLTAPERLIDAARSLAERFPDAR